MGCRVLLKQDAVLLCLYGELATHGILDVADGGVEIVDGEPAHRGERCQRDGEWSTREEEIRQPSIGRFLKTSAVAIRGCHFRGNQVPHGAPHPHMRGMR